MAAIRVFEAAARHENFTKAASELGMTQAAVSYQIRLLEERLGTTLFGRSKGRVSLTDAGRRAAAPLSRAFDAMDAAFAQLRTEDETMLTVSTTHTFANTWLAWRLGGFQMENSGMALRLDTSDQLVDFASADIDCAVRTGRESWPDLHCERLFSIGFTPMCSPDFLERNGPIAAPEQLLRLAMISPQDPWWPHWLREAGVNVPERRIPAGVRLDSQALEGNAAMAGQGVAMLTPFFWRHDLAAGRLVRLFPLLSTRGFGYWLVYPEHRRNVPKIKRFRDWLRREIDQELAVSDEEAA